MRINSIKFGNPRNKKLLFLILSFSYFSLSIGQNVNIFNGMTESMLLKHYRESGIKYSIEGIWVTDLELTYKMYSEGKLILNNTRKAPNKTKTAFVLVGNKIHILKYDPVKLTYIVVKDFVKPTPNKFIYNYTTPSSYDAEIGIQFEEFNTEIIVKDNFIDYTTSPKPANEKVGEEIILIGRYTGYKLAPTDQDLIGTELSKKITFHLKPFNNMYYIPLSIGGKIIDYMIDSGASYITITPEMETNLKDMGILRNTDYQGEIEMELADNSTRILKKVVIPTMKIGNVAVTNVEAVISSGSLLLGRSFIIKFKSWNLDNNMNILTVETY